MNNSPVKRILQQPDKSKAVAALEKVNLTKKERYVMEHIFFDGMTAEETAESMDVSVSAVNKWKAKGMKKCLEVFK